MTRTQNRRARENPGAFGVRRTRFFTGLRIPRRACAVNRFERVLDNDMTSIAAAPAARAPGSRVYSRLQPRPVAVLAEPVPVANVLVPHIREMAHSAGMSPTSAARNHDANRPAGGAPQSQTHIPGGSGLRAWCSRP